MYAYVKLFLARSAHYDVSRRFCSLRSRGIAVAALLIGSLGLVTDRVDGGTIGVNGGSLSLNLDGAAIANGVDAPYINSFLSAWYGTTLDPNQTFMEFARHFSPAQAQGLSVLDFRPQPNPPVADFRDLRNGWVRPSSDNLLYGVNGRNPIGPQPLGRGAVPTSFEFDPTDITGTASGLIGTRGATSFWYSNDAMIDSGSVWLAFGDLILEYDPSRFVPGGNSGWYLTNNLLFPNVLFDTTNVTADFTGGLLTVTGDLVVSQEFYSAWGLLEGLDVGSFHLTATTVPEPSCLVMLLAGIPVIGSVARARRLSSRQEE